MARPGAKVGEGPGKLREFDVAQSALKFPARGSMPAEVPSGAHLPMLGNLRHELMAGLLNKGTHIIVPQKQKVKKPTFPADDVLPASQTDFGLDTTQIESQKPRLDKNCCGATREERAEMQSKAAQEQMEDYSNTRQRLNPTGGTSASDRKVKAAFHEVFHNVPKNVKKTGKTGAAKRKMMIAISLSKARAAGAKVPKK